MKTAIITGASVGIGRASAGLFLADGYQVFNLSRRECPVEGVTSIACDLSSDDSLSAALARLEPEVRQSDSVALVYNASRMLKDSAVDCASDSLRDIL
ncbi:MAG: SDR family NAD(P)-dependent oxidoreductase, partial [Halioglobus sp.]|nr:SDR family NAD(P)-dependent oxidoreductase [Halioglobus sp.]